MKIVKSTINNKKIQHLKIKVPQAAVKGLIYNCAFSLSFLITLVKYLDTIWTVAVDVIHQQKRLMCAEGSDEYLG